MSNECYINGEKHIIDIKSGRDTIHMAINGEVSEHPDGNSWNDMKYAILIPLDEIPNEKIGGACPEDTWVRGNLQLSNNCWILCPKGEVQNVQRNNPCINVMGYDGKNVSGKADALLVALGFACESVQAHGWKDIDHSQKFIELMKKEGLDVRTAHIDSIDFQKESVMSRINTIVAMCKHVNDMNILKTTEDIDNLIYDTRKKEEDMGGC